MCNNKSTVIVFIIQERHKTTLTLIAAQIEQEKDGLDRTIKKMTKKGKKRK